MVVRGSRNIFQRPEEGDSTMSISGSLKKCLVGCLDLGPYYLDVLVNAPGQLMMCEVLDDATERALVRAQVEDMQHIGDERLDPHAREPPQRVPRLLFRESQAVAENCLPLFVRVAVTEHANNIFCLKFSYGNANIFLR